LPGHLRFPVTLRACESFHHSDLILRSPSDKRGYARLRRAMAKASRRMAASPNLLPWFETARYARLLTMRPSVLERDTHPEALVRDCVRYFNAVAWVAWRMIYCQRAICLRSVARGPRR
jgi:hypothetical protein